MGQVITFYSYKGGVGRTMAMANVAVLLSRWGYNVLTVDWDLEAPGLEYFYADYVDVRAVSEQEGIIDILNRASTGESHSFLLEDWVIDLIKIKLPKSEGALHLLTSGKRNESYFSRVRELDLKEFYANKGGFFIEALRDQWKQAYDFILIDSRTGITDIGGICTIQLPDVLVSLFTATDQSLSGIIDVFNKAKTARRDLPVSRSSLQAIPVPSKFDTGTEFVISQKWLDRFAEELSPFYANWLPISVNRRDFLAATKIPYIPYFSFGEKLPVIEEGTVDPAGLGYAYETLAAILANNLNYAEQVIDQRDEFVRYAFKGAVRPAPATEKRPDPGSELPMELGPRVFLSYTVEDRNKVTELYERLSNAGYRPWMDSRDLLPGERWDESIRDAIRRSDFFLVCLSSNSVNKTGFIQKEIKIALDLLEQKAPGETWLIPVRLDDSPAPARLKDYHWLNMFESGGWQRLLQTLDQGHRRQVAGTALVFTSLSEEYEAVRGYLTGLREETMPDGTVCEMGRFSGDGRSWEVGVIELNARDSRAAIEGARVIQFVKPSVVISIGVSAGVRKAGPGDVVVATRVYAYDEMGEHSRAMTSLGASSYRLEQRARAEAKKKAWLKRLGATTAPPQVLLGPIVVGGRLTTLERGEIHKALRAKFADALSFELGGMELLSALYASKDIDIFIVRGISEPLDSVKIYAPDASVEAARNASAFALEVLSKVERGSHEPKVNKDAVPDRGSFSQRRK